MARRAIPWLVFVAVNRSRRSVSTPATVREPAGTPSGNSAAGRVTFIVKAAPFVASGYRRGGFATVRTGAKPRPKSGGSGGECHPPIRDGNTMKRNHGIQRPGTIEIGHCPVCGAAIYWRPGTKGQRPVYDTFACRQRAYRARQARQDGQQ